MKNANRSIRVETRGEGHMCDLTRDLHSFLGEIEAVQGLLTVSVVGSTAAISTIEFESGLQHDLPQWLDKVLPRGKYRHNDTWDDDNGHSHLRSTLIGTSFCVPVSGGAPKLGTWQQVFLIELDTRGREREVVLSFLGD